LQQRFEKTQDWHGRLVQIAVDQDKRRWTHLVFSADTRSQSLIKEPFNQGRPTPIKPVFRDLSGGLFPATPVIAGDEEPSLRSLPSLSGTP
jgi:hypothetical protein